MNRKTNDLPMTKELGLRLRSFRKRVSLTRASFSGIADLLDTYTARPLPIEQEGRDAVIKVTEALPEQIGKQALYYDIKTTAARRAEKKPPLSSAERVMRVVNLAAAASRRKRLDIQNRDSHLFLRWSACRFASQFSVELPARNCKEVVGT